ncbi:MAG: dihydrolipoyl dehydrogenase [Halioglobus sp.]|nr:dihydrolipoyl dehydrogenase [Halioglobus sp.]
MRELHVEIAIIGAGTAGLTAYNAARKHTDDVVLIEDGPYGTTCARVGCMPSKLLIAAAERAHDARRAGLFGIEAKEVLVDGPRVLERVRSERDSFVGSVLASMEKIPADRKLRGRARFIASMRLAVGDDLELEAQRIIIATGASPHVPDMLSHLGDRLLVNDDVFELQGLPDSVAVFGCGVVGLELGQALHRLGVRVRMFGRDGALAGIVDEEIRDYAEACFKAEFPLDTRADVKDIVPGDDGVTITFAHPQRGVVTEVFEYVLAATGRRPNLDALALENSGLALDERGIPHCDPATLQCEAQPVFIVGDANNRAPFLHEAALEGRIAGDNAGRYPDVRPATRQVPLSVTFSDPQIANVGLATAEICSARGLEAVTGSTSFEGQGRSRVIGRNQGMLKVHADCETGVFLGAEMFGPAAEHIAHLLAWSAQQSLTVTDMLSMPFYHPVIEEGVRTALKDCKDRLDRVSAGEDPCLSCGPGS